MQELYLLSVFLEADTIYASALGIAGDRSRDAVCQLAAAAAERTLAWLPLNNFA